MKCILLFISVTMMVGCAPTYVSPQNVPTATAKVIHIGDHPSSTSFDIFSEPKCEKKFYVGEIADVGTNIDLKKSATTKLEANRVLFISGTRITTIRSLETQAWCSIMFSFTPKQNSVYQMKMNATSSGNCSVEVVEEGLNKVPEDFRIYDLNRICRGDDVYFEK